MVTVRCCVNRVYVDAVTGRLNGAGVDGCTSQCRIKGSAEKDVVRSAGLDTMLNPGVWSVVPPCRSGTTMFRQRFLACYHPESECI